MEMAKLVKTYKIDLPKSKHCYNNLTKKGCKVLKARLLVEIKTKTQLGVQWSIKIKNLELVLHFNIKM